MDTLRRKCPWDAGQTHASLMPYLLEETYEALDALAAADPAAVREELGDVLLQVLFHARIAAERTDGTGYDIDDVAGGIIDKLTRRHPHVFGSVSVSGADEVMQNWDSIKAAERAAKRAGEGDRASALDGVPLAQPALSLAAQLLRRAGKAGVPGFVAEDAAVSVAEDAAASVAQDATAGSAEAGPAGDGTAVRAGSADDAAAELGRELFALVRRAQEESVDPELALRAAALAYAAEVRAWESAAGRDKRA